MLNTFEKWCIIFAVQYIWEKYIWTSIANSPKVFYSPPHSPHHNRFEEGGTYIAFGVDPGVSIALSALLSPEPMGGFWPNLHRHIIGREERSD